MSARSELGMWTGGYDGEGYVSVLVVRHPLGISAEGADLQRTQIESAIGSEGCDLAGRAFGIGNASTEAERVVRATWTP